MSKVNIDSHGLLSRYFGEALMCPKLENYSQCGYWCPLCIDITILKHFNNSAEPVEASAVSIMCGCQPVTYEIVEDNR